MFSQLLPRKNSGSNADFHCAKANIVPAFSEKKNQSSSEYFELQIKVLNSSNSFVLSKVKRKTSFFELKQAIDKLKHFKVPMQSLHLPDYLKEILITTDSSLDT